MFESATRKEDVIFQNKESRNATWKKCFLMYTETLCKTSVEIAFFFKSLAAFQDFHQYKNVCSYIKITYIRIFYVHLTFSQQRSISYQSNHVATKPNRI